VRFEASCGVEIEVPRGHLNGEAGVSTQLISRSWVALLFPCVLLALLSCGGGAGGNGVGVAGGGGGSQNPVPSIAGLSPTFGIEGVSSETVTISGSNFLSSSTVSINGVSHSATFVNASTLTVQLQSGDVAEVGTDTILVTNPSPGGGASAPASLNIVAMGILSVSPSSAAPLSQITISGGGFDTSSLVWVTFSNSNGFSLSVPPLPMTQTSITVPAPLVVDPTTGAPVAGPLTVQVSQLSGSNVVTSNSVQLTVTQLPPPSPLPAGSITLGFLQGEITALQDFRQSILGTPQDTAQFETAYTGQVNAINEFIAQVQSIMNGASSASLGSINGTPINATAADLLNSDSVLLGLAQSVSALPQGSASQAALRPARKRRAFGTAGSCTASGIQSSAAALYDVATSNGTTQGQLSAAVAQLICASGNTSDSDFNQAAAIGVAAVFGLSLLGPAALPIVTYETVGPYLAGAYLEAGLELQLDVAAAQSFQELLLTLVQPALGPQAGLILGGSQALYNLLQVVEELLNCAPSCAGPPTFTIAPEAVTLGSEAGQNFTATVTYSNGSTVDLTSLATWSSSDVKVAIVLDAPGSIVAEAPGTAEIEASFGPLLATAEVTVEGSQIVINTLQCTVDSQDFPNVYSINESGTVQGPPGSTFYALVSIYAAQPTSGFSCGWPNVVQQGSSTVGPYAGYASCGGSSTQSYETTWSQTWSSNVYSDNDGGVVNLEVYGAVNGALTFSCPYTLPQPIVFNSVFP